MQIWPDGHGVLGQFEVVPVPLTQTPDPLDSPGSVALHWHSLPHCSLVCLHVRAQTPLWQTLPVPQMAPLRRLLVTHRPVAKSQLARVHGLVGCLHFGNFWEQLHVLRPASPTHCPVLH